MHSVTFNGLYSFTFTIEIMVSSTRCNVLSAFLRAVFAHHRSQLPLHNLRTQYGGRREDSYMTSQNNDQRPPNTNFTRARGDNRLLDDFG